MSDVAMYQVSTLQALALGYTRGVITVGELKKHGDIGLGTFEDVNGEMIFIDGLCCRAMEDGNTVIADDTMGVPFSSVSIMEADRTFALDAVSNIDALKDILTLRIEEGFGLNSMHIVRIDGTFSKVAARSEAPYRSQHVTLKDVLSMTQRDFQFTDIKGSLVCIYYPDFMDGINASGWHLHFISDDRTKGGHVFDLELAEGTAKLMKINRIEIQLPTDPAFDTYALKNADDKEIKEVEQGDGK